MHAMLCNTWQYPFVFSPPPQKKRMFFYLKKFKKLHMEVLDQKVLKYVIKSYIDANVFYLASFVKLAHENS
jgi:hypothetical protein